MRSPTPRPRGHGTAASVVFGAALLVGCPHRGGPESGPREVLPSWSAAIETTGEATVAGLALAPDGRVAVAVRASARTAIGGGELTPEAGGAVVALLARGGVPAWVQALPAEPGPVAIGATQVIAAVSGTGAAGAVELRGEPGSALLAFDAAAGAPRWTLAIGATEWARIRAIAVTAKGDVVAVGSFAGTL